MNLRQIRHYNHKQQEVYAAKTGIQVDIQNIGKNTRTIALREKNSLKEIRKGVFLKKEVLEFPDNFVNVYDLYWNQKNSMVEPSIHSEKKPYYMLDYMQSDPSALAVINGSFFFLVDFPEREPKDYPFHFCVRDGKIMGLLSLDEPVLYIQNGELNAKNAKAQGSLKIADTLFNWAGPNRASKKATATLYNSGTAKLIKEFDPKTGVRVGRLDYRYIHTPAKKSATDIVVNQKRGKLVVSEINAGGGTHFFEGLFILQIKTQENTFKVGDSVTPLVLDGLDLTSITAAITIGKGVRDPYFYTPERIASRDARSVIAKDVFGNIHFMVFDGSKYIPHFKGVSANDISSYLPKEKYEWAYFLDGGSSSRIVVKEGKKETFLANEFAFKKISNEVFLWDSKRHRKLASTIALKLRKN